VTEPLLRRHFVRTLVHNDLIAPRGDTELAFFHALALATLPGLLYAYSALVRHVARAPADPWLRATALAADRAFLVAFSMLALAFVAVWAWDELLPTRRDFRVLGPLPVATQSLLAAKAAAVLQLLAICALALNLFSAPVFPLAAGRFDPGPAAVLGRVIGHLLTIGLASAFVGFSAVAARGLLTRPGARRAVQLLAFVLLVQAVFLLPAYVRAMVRQSDPEKWLLLPPPTWFVGLHATLTGSPRAIDHGLALTAVGGVLASWLACRSSYRAALEREAARESALAPGRASALARLWNRLALRKAEERAGFWFVTASLWRSPRHRLTLTGYAAVGLATSGIVSLIAGAAASNPARMQSALLQATFVGMFFLLLGLRSAFGMPAELRANWLFRCAGTGPAAAVRSGIRKAALLVAAAPVLASLPALAAARFDAASLVGHLVFGVTLAGLAAEAVLFRRRSMPLASDYVPGKSNLRLRWPLYIGSFFVFVGGAAALDRALQREPVALLLFVAGVLVVSALLRRVERERADEDTLLFEDESEAMPSLGLYD
jgi:hypothetical protein